MNVPPSPPEAGDKIVCLGCKVGRPIRRLRRYVHQLWICQHCSTGWCVKIDARGNPVWKIWGDVR